MKRSGNPSRKFNIIYFGDHWDEYLRRRQQIAARLSKFEGVDKVIYVELPLTMFSFLKFLMRRSLPKVAKSWRRVLNNGLMSKDDGVWILTPVTLLPHIPVKVIAEINRFIDYWLQLLILRFYIRKMDIRDSILWISQPFAGEFIGKLGEKKICYDRTEDFAYKHGCTSVTQGLVRKNDSDIIKKADFVFVQTREMLEMITPQNKNVYLIPNAVDVSLYSKTITDKSDMLGIPRPIMTYCGNINSRINFEILEYVAAKHPEWSLVIIGHIAPGLKNLSLLKSFSNVYFLGVKPYCDLPSYLKKADVCLMPHEIDRFTESQSPLKLFDYLAAGKAIVSTQIAGVRGYEDIVRIGSTKEEFVSLIEDSLLNDLETAVERRKAIANENTWDKRVEDICTILQSH